MGKMTINPKRLNWCLEYYRIGLEELAEKVNISPATLQRARDGEQALSYKQLVKLADKFAVDRLFFTGREELDTTKMLTPQFRTVNDSLPLRRSPDMISLLRRVEKHRGIYEGVLEEIDMHEKLRVKPCPILRNRSDFAANGAKVRQWLGIKGGEDFDGLRLLVEDKNIMVFLSLGHRGPWRVPEDAEGRPDQGLCP